MRRSLWRALGCRPRRGGFDSLPSLIFKMNFLESKKKQLNREDKSNEGEVDKGIADLCKKINEKKEYYTTSSCAGRIVLIKALPEKAKNVFLFKTHEKISFSQLKKELENASKKYSRLIYFKQESCILHVACVDLGSGLKLLNKARIAGWKRSGMIASGKRVILELMSTEKLELPIMDKGRLLVNDSYLKLIVKEANSKLERAREKIKKFKDLI